jgi:hypothetical protein
MAAPSPHHLSVWGKGCGASAESSGDLVHPRHDDAAYWTKYSGEAAEFGLTDAITGFSTRPKISVDRVWTTPAG